jgi:predicted Zn-dependent protease
LRSKKNIFYSAIFLCLCCLSACQKQDASGSNFEYNTLGTAAHALLNVAPYTVLQIQLHYMPGYQPDTASVNNLLRFLNRYLNKPGGIQVMQQQIAASGKPVLSLSDIVKIENDNRTFFTAYKTITVHILITDGYYNLPDIFATSYWNTSLCVFGKTIYDNSGGPGQVDRSVLLTTIFEHEFGHLLGLVNQGSPMQASHLDAANGAHCDNNNCLMYYGIESYANSNVVPELDANCRADLKANGGK